MSRPRGRPPTATSALVPAAAQSPAAVADLEAVLNSDAIEVFAHAVGGREKLADTLAVAGTGSVVEKITTLLLDPRYATWGLARLCQTAGITVADLFASYRKALIARAHIESSHIIASRLPPIVTDVMDKALSDPTVERHKLALELGQLLEKKGGIVVQQNNMAATLGGTAPGSLEQLQQAVGNLLFGDRRAQDAADVVEADAATPPPPIDPDVDPDDEEDDEETDDLPFEQPDSPPRPAPEPELPPEPPAA